MIHDTSFDYTEFEKNPDKMFFRWLLDKFCLEGFAHSTDERRKKLYHSIKKEATEILSGRPEAIELGEFGEGDVSWASSRIDVIIGSGYDEILSPKVKRTYRRAWRESLRLLSTNQGYTVRDIVPKNHLVPFISKAPIDRDDLEDMYNVLFNNGYIICRFHEFKRLFLISGQELKLYSDRSKLISTNEFKRIVWKGSLNSLYYFLHELKQHLIEYQKDIFKHAQGLFQLEDNPNCDFSVATEKMTKGRVGAAHRQKIDTAITMISPSQG